MAVALLKRSKYENRKLMQTIRDQHAFGVDVYPKTLQDAYELLENHSSTDNVKRKEDQRSRRERELLRRNNRRAGQEVETGVEVEGEEATQVDSSSCKTPKLWLVRTVE